MSAATNRSRVIRAGSTNLKPSGSQIYHISGTCEKRRLLSVEVTVPCTTHTILSLFFRFGGQVSSSSNSTVWGQRPLSQRRPLMMLLPPLLGKHIEVKLIPQSMELLVVTLLYALLLAP